MGPINNKETKSMKHSYLKDRQIAFLLFSTGTLRLQSPLSVDLNNKRTMSQKGGKDWTLVSFWV